jgi:xanthine dehydrogenase accessory factor
MDEATSGAGSEPRASENGRRAQPASCLSPVPKDCTENGAGIRTAAHRATSTALRATGPALCFEDIHRKIVQLTDGGVRFALVTVLSTSGSTPQQAGAKAIVEESGLVWGTVGGGLVEAEARRIAVETCRAQRHAVFEFHADSARAQESGAICGGSMRLLVDPTAAKNRASYMQAAVALEGRARGDLVTTIRDAEVSVQWRPADPGCRPGPGSTPASTGPTLRAGPAGDAEIFVDPVIPRPLLVIVGGGHVGQALAALATVIGFDVTVIDDRSEFTAPVLFPPGVKTRCGRVADELAALSIDADTYVVIVTRGHQQDAEALAACIHGPAAYLGMIGSRRKVALIRESFLESALATEEEFGRVFAPIGLEIGAVTVPEIATSIAAQLIAVRRNKAGHKDR